MRSGRLAGCAHLRGGEPDFELDVEAAVLLIVL